MPHQVFFEAKQQDSDYDITGVSIIAKNTLSCKIPDSSGGAYIRGGDCVVDVLINNNTTTIKQISIIGLYLYDNKRKEAVGFDIYDNTKKKIGKPYNKDYKQYISFISDFVSKLSFKRQNKITTPESHVYCRLILTGSG